MNNTSKMAAMLAAMRKEMNGAVTAAMEQGGIRYPLNYGVAIPKIRAIASGYAPDHGLAKFLYRQQVRELKLAAYTVADPALVTVAELDFWGGGVDNAELAENLASSLLCRTPVAGDVAGLWLDDNRGTLIKYCALLTIAKATDRGALTLPAGYLHDVVSHYSGSAEPLLRRGAEAVEMRLER